MIRYRTGRELDRTIYRQHTETPSDVDTFMGMMDSPKDSALVVELLNDDAKTIAEHCMTDQE